MRTLQQISPDDTGRLVLRLALGTMWLSHGLVLKLLTFGIAGLAGWLESVGLPAGMAWPLTLAEIAGGVLILVGWHGRAVSTLLIPILLGATWIHSGNGWAFTNAQGGWEYPVFLVFASVTHLLLGDGAYVLFRQGRFASRRGGFNVSAPSHG
jgi:putative oxidoreductase